MVRPGLSLLVPECLSISSRLFSTSSALVLGGRLLSTEGIKSRIFNLLLWVLVDLVVTWRVGIHWLATVASVRLTNWCHFSRSIGVVPVNWNLDGGGGGDDSDKRKKLHLTSE